MTDYESLHLSLKGLLDGESDALANLANAAALLWEHLGDINWAGFYLHRDGELVLGPFQGRPACTRIAPGRGVCGAAAERRETVVVPDVHAFPGHIACDGASRSEIVVPLFCGGAVVGVLDVDSPSLHRFSEEDRQGLERFAAILTGAVRWPQIVSVGAHRPMRRRDRQIDDVREIAAIIGRCNVLRLGFGAPEGAYIVPLNFGWEMDSDTPIFYMHCARDGRKLDMLAASDRVGFEMDCGHDLIAGPRACDYGFRYESVIGSGCAQLLSDPAEKAWGLSKIMLQMTGREMPVSPEDAAHVAVLRLRADEWSCKRHE